MSRKGRDGVPSEELTFGGGLEAALFAAAMLTVAGVALYFNTSVNRVFDVPKALVLKVGGGGVLLVWLLAGLFGRGVPWRSIRLFIAPVGAMTLAVGISTLLSIDVPMSLYGVYERQFGLQGFLACIGLFVVAATAIRTRRGALLGLGWLLLVGSIIGAYALLQARGYDPYGFFRQEHTKVYSTLGNATFAGNALALIFPISAILAVVATARGVAKSKWKENGWLGWLGVLFGFTATIALQLVYPSAVFEKKLPSPDTQAGFVLLMGVSAAFVAGLALVGNGGLGHALKQGGRTRALADAALAGACLAMVVAIVVGLICTRTRGAWVGSFVAVILGLILLPILFNDDAKLKRWVRWGCYSTLALIVLVPIVGAQLYPNHVYVGTIKSIPAAFEPDRTDYGKGQGTRPYLWAESPRVLFNHDATIARKNQDIREAAEKANPELLEGLPYDEPSTRALEGRALDPAWRRAAVWLFGIGIETYRFAFMSHKSKRLEAMDPMTNHDNPHNNYLYVLASFGIMGLAAYLWMLARLLLVSIRHFAPKRRPLLLRAPRRGVMPAVTDWSTNEDSLDNAELVIRSGDPKVLIAAIKEQTGLDVRVDKGRVIVRSGSSSGSGPRSAGSRSGSGSESRLGSASLSADALVSELERVSLPAEFTRSERAIAFGVLTSFFSYACYSVAGFDSVACSVFFYFLLGCAATYFAPSLDERPRPLLDQVRRHWQEWRSGGVSSETKPGDAWRPSAMVVGLASILLVLPAFVMFGGYRVWRAERLFVGPEKDRRAQAQSIDRIENTKDAIRMNPHESYYRQNLGSSLMAKARAARQRSIMAQNEGRARDAGSFDETARTYAAEAEAAFYSALPHAWAPENIFISLFQLHYTEGKREEAERVLERALQHSPHLGSVRAHLAVLKLQRGAFQEALTDCLWVLEVDPGSGVAARTCGRAYLGLGELKNAEHYLQFAKTILKDDKLLDGYLSELRAAQEASAASGS